jgi:hypothetical protein
MTGLQAGRNYAVLASLFCRKEYVYVIDERVTSNYSFLEIKKKY